MQRYLFQVGSLIHQKLARSLPVSPIVSFSTSSMPCATQEEEEEDSDEAFKASETFKNLGQIFMNEVQAHRRYMYAADIADTAGDIDAARVFRDTAESEAKHATLILDLLAEIGDPVTEMPFNTTTECLQSVIESEAGDIDEYTEYAKTAREEGYNSIADYLDEIVAAEAKHHRRFQRVLTEMENNDI